MASPWINPEHLECERRGCEFDPSFVVLPLVGDVLLGGCKFLLHRRVVAGVQHDVDVALGLAELKAGGVLGPHDHQHFNWRWLRKRAVPD